MFILQCDSDDGRSGGGVRPAEFGGKRRAAALRGPAGEERGAVRLAPRPKEDKSRRISDFPGKWHCARPGKLI